MALKLPRLSAALCRCLLVLVAIGSSCRLTLATGRAALPADEQQVAAQASSSYERDDHYKCRGEGAVCSRTSQCCAGACLRHTCWSHPHHRPPCRQRSEECWDSEDCCGAFVCGHVGYHDHPVCYQRPPGPVDVCPVVTVTPPSAPVFVCENSTAPDVTVAFNVSTDTDAALDVPATITASDGRNCSLQGATTVPSPSTVQYACPQLSGTWSPPGSFELTLTAFAGPVGCASSANSANATVTVRPSGCTPFEFTGLWQNYTVPAGVSSIRIDASGAQGGSAQPRYVGGRGARMSGSFTVSPNDTLIILVGGAGKVNNNTANAGGGGGSFVVLANSSSPDVITSGPFNGTPVTPLVIAGGGGGTGFGNRDGYPGQTGQNGTTGADNTGEGGGVVKTSGAGEGGNASPTGPDAGSTSPGQGSGGGGFRGSGQDDCERASCVGVVYGTGGKAFVSGGAGGVDYFNTGCNLRGASGSSDVTIGGFGGGGGGGCSGTAGGGGGYSGGDRGEVAGGAGSFNAGTDPDNTPGDRSGNGTVSVCVICA